MSNIRENINNSLDLYEKYKDVFKNNHMKWGCYLSIDYTFETPVSEDVYNVIASASIDAYLHDDNNISLSSISGFLAIGLKDKKITLDEIESIDKWDLLSAFNDGNYNLFKNNMTL